jgi:MFS family permease
VLLSHWGAPAFVLIAGGLAGGAFGLAAPTIAATMMSLAGPEGSRGGVIGWFMTMDGLGHAAGPAAAGLLLAAFGASAVLLAAGGLFLVVAYIALTSRLGEDEAAEMTPARAGVPTSLIGGQS